MNTPSAQSRAGELRRQWRDMEQAGSHLFPSQIAEQLQVSEAELLASRQDERVTPLRGDWDRLLDALPLLGTVKTVTRNCSAVIEKDGTYPQYQHFGGHALFVGETVDLRLSLGQWKFAFAVEKPSGDGFAPHSLQFFDRHGEPVHKMLLLPGSSREAFHRMAQSFRAPELSEIAVEAIPSLPADHGLTAKECATFLAAWSQLRDAHDFFPLLGGFHLSRLAAFEAAQGKFTRKVSNDAAEKLLRQSARTSLSLMIFAGNRGCLQIHKGVLENIAPRGEWLSAMCPGSESHLRPADIHASWVVEKPTQDGSVVSLESFDSSGQDIAVFFGTRKEGETQSQQWRNEVSALK